jgi:hypothetical protein
VEKGRQFPPLGERGVVAAQDVHSDVVGTRVEVFAQALVDVLDAAPGDGGVDEPIASPRYEVAVVEAKAAQVVLVGGKADEHTHAGAGGCPRPVSVGVQNDGLMRRDQRVRPDRGSLVSGVLGSDEERVDAGGTCSGERNHSGAQRAKQASGCGQRCRGRVQVVKVVTHRLDGLAELLAVALRGVGVADSKTDDSSGTVGLVKSREMKCDVVWWLAPDAEHAEQDRAVRCRRQELVGVVEHAVAVQPRNPQCAQPELVQFGGCVLNRGPAGIAQLHAPHPHWPQRLCQLTTCHRAYLQVLYRSFRNSTLARTGHQ